MSRRRRDFPAFFDHLFSSCSGASSRRSFSNSGRSSTIFFHFRFISFRFLTFSFYFIILNLLPFFFVCFYLISFDFYFRWRLPPLLKWRRRRLRCELPFRDSFRDAFGILSGFVVSFSFSFFFFVSKFYILIVVENRWTCLCFLVFHSLCSCFVCRSVFMFHVVTK